MNYEELTNPSKLFHSVEEVASFCDLAESREELTSFLGVCESYELFEYCAVIRDKIEEYDCNRN